MTEPYWEPLGAMPVGQSALVCLYDSILAADAASIDIPAISQAYAHLKLVLDGQIAGNGSLACPVQFRVNGLSTGIYDGTYDEVQAGTFVGAEYGSSIAAWLSGSVYGTGNTAGARVIAEAIIADYARAHWHTFQGNYYGDWSGGNTGAGGRRRGDCSGLIRDLSPITSLSIMSNVGNIKAGTRVSLYGMLLAGQSSIPTITLAPGGIGTAFPVSPANGELFTLVDSLTAPTYAWDFRYNASITDAYKWVCIGGGPLVIEAAFASTASASFVDLSPAGPSFAIPRIGIYDVTVESEMQNNTANTSMAMGYAIGAAAAVDIDAAKVSNAVSSGAGGYLWASRTKRKTFSSLATLTAKYKASGGSGNFDARTMKVMPVRLA